MRSKKFAVLFITVFVAAVLLFTHMAGEEKRDGDLFTAMCLKNSLPAVEVLQQEEKTKPEGEKKPEAEKKPEQTLEAVSKKFTPVKSGESPQVLIYHTHATESYLPASGGNYHVTAEENTVRDVGNVLAKSLEEGGIKVIHDKTLHDHPSYDGSYGRSAKTVSSLLSTYPTVRLIIDLHRDAIASDCPGDTCSAMGKTCAAYSYVIGNTAKNAAANRELIGKFNAAAADYGGYKGEILERSYAYNADLCRNGILLEMGNNRNNIADARAGAEVLGKIMAQVLLEN